MNTRWVLCAGWLLWGCATSAPAETARKPDYAGRCELIGLEQRDLPADQPSDQVALVARFRFGGPPASSSEPAELTFQVTRERADELRAQLIANPTVLCRPDEEARTHALPDAEPQQPDAP